MASDSSKFVWNSVDVRGDDGLLHNGRMIDVVDGGVVVHFGGTGHSGPKLIPFGHVSHRQYSEYLQEERRYEGREPREEERNVEVRLRLQPDDPWKWYPGILLDAFGLVSVTLPDRQLKGFAVEQRIRERSSLEDLELSVVLVNKERFSRRQVVVPSVPGVAHLSDDQLIEIFNCHCRQRHYWMMATHVLNNPHHGLFKGLAVLGFFNSKDHWPDYHGNRNECHQPLDELLLSLLLKEGDTAEPGRFVIPAEPCPDGDIQSLYRDRTIFPQIFECLTTVQQTKRRGVCRTWDAILTSAGIRRILTVSQPRYGRNYTRHVYRFAACLNHCWTKQTRVLVLYGGKSSGACDGVRLAETARLLQLIRAEKGLPTVEVLLLAREWDFPNINGASWMKTLWEIFLSVADVCQQVVMKDVGVNVELQQTSHLDERFKVVRFSDQRITRQLALNDFQTMLHDGLRYLDTEDVERLADRKTSRKRKIDEMQNTTQAVERWHRPIYRWH